MYLEKRKIVSFVSIYSGLWSYSGGIHWIPVPFHWTPLDSTGFCQNDWSPTGRGHCKVLLLLADWICSNWGEWSWTWGCISKIIKASRPSEQMEEVGFWVFEVVGGRTKTKQRKCLTLGIQYEHVMSEFQWTLSHSSQLPPLLFYWCPLNTSRNGL